MENKLYTVIDLTLLTSKNASFSVSKSGFLFIDTSIVSNKAKDHSHEHAQPDADENNSIGEDKILISEHDKSKEEKILSGKRRAFLHRTFPFDNPFEYISVSDDNGEIGIIESIDNFPESELLKNELEKKYFFPKILKVISIKERFGYSYWNVECDRGNFNFTVKDTFKSIIHVNDNRIFICDVDSNRFEIENLTKLDRKSFRKIELYI